MINDFYFTNDSLPPSATLDMAIFKLPRFLRRFFRRNMNPRTEEQVWSAKDKFSIAYAIIAWNAAGYVLWQIFGKKNVHWPVDVGIKNVEEENVRPGKYPEMKRSQGKGFWFKSLGALRT